MARFLKVMSLIVWAATILGALPAVSQGARDRRGLERLGAVEEAFLQGAHTRVIGEATSLLRDTPGMHDAYFLRGASHWHLGNASAARQDLATYVQTSGAFNAEAQDILASMRAGESVDVPLASQVQLRVGAMCSDRFVRPELSGLDPHRITEGPAARYGWDVDMPYSAFCSVEYNGFSIYPLDEPRARWLSQSLEVVLRTDRRSPGIAFEWRLGGDYVGRDYGVDLLRGDTSIECEWTFARDHVVRASLEVGYDDYPTDEAFSGVPATARVDMEHYFERMSIFWGVNALHHRARLSSLSHTQLGADAGIACVAAEGVFVGANVRVSQVGFDRYARDFGIDREDDYYAVDVWASITLNAYLRVLPFAEYAWNDSSVNADDFERTIFGLDLVLGLD